MYIINSESIKTLKIAGGVNVSTQLLKNNLIYQPFEKKLNGTAVLA